MQVAISLNGIPIRLSDERWQHITRRHPEMENSQTLVSQTIAAPDLIQAGDTGELLALRVYENTQLGRIYVVVAYREISQLEGFVLTAYLTRRPSQRRKVLWMR